MDWFRDDNRICVWFFTLFCRTTHMKEPGIQISQDFSSRHILCWQSEASKSQNPISISGLIISKPWSMVNAPLRQNIRKSNVIIPHKITYIREIIEYLLSDPLLWYGQSLTVRLYTHSKEHTIYSMLSKVTWRI